MDFGFNTEIARLTHCADEAAFVHRVYFLIMNNEANDRNYHEGKYWTYDSFQALAKIFDFWTAKQLRRIVKNCVELGLIETGQFSENAFDRRNWYTVTERVKSIYENGRKDAPESANAPDGTGGSICPNGQMDTLGRANADSQSGKSDLPKRSDGACPNGQMIKEAIKDQLEDQLEGAPAKKQRRKRVEPERQRYGEFGNVKLSEAELDKLCARWEPGQVEREIEALSAYMRSKGKRYADHYATLLNWLKRDCPQGRQALAEEGWTDG